MTIKDSVNDFVLHMATVNGSGSQTANLLVVKTLFRMGIPVSGKNLFPSNIQGLPTWFTIRANPMGFTARRTTQDIVISLNPTSAVEDQKQLRPGGLFLHSNDCRLKPEQIRPDITQVQVPFRELAAATSDSVKSRKLLTNIVYVGILSELLPLDQTILKQTVYDHLKGKESLIEPNMKAIEAGRQWAQNAVSEMCGAHATKPVVRAQTVPGGNQKNILIDGNSAASMGLLDGGCTFAAWYPITPSSSVMEGFLNYAEQWRMDTDGKIKAAVVQAEDELAAISMALGAGWAGARAMTATSGPGLSLMSEAAGLAYFAEIPAVIWNVQRAGPSTGLPTRTMQGDVISAAYLSHGDTKHVLLFPADPAECFAFGKIAFDLAEQLQTLVIVLSDLNLGMNLHSTPEWSASVETFKRGKVLGEKELAQMTHFARYSDADGDGVGARTLPGTNHPLAAYFTRGTGHDESSRYTEDPVIFAKTLQRLNRKWQTARQLVPKPEIEMVTGAKIGILAYGSTHEAIAEIRHGLKTHHIATHYLRLKSFPFTNEVEKFLESCEKVFVIEQNRDGQMRQLLSAEFPQLAARLHGVVNYDGWPLAAAEVQSQVIRGLT
ncbi:MAG: 2-oxoacid:acceptor oxidoreductase subunit alpha [Bdellovibrionales bacterium]